MWTMRACADGVMGGGWLRRAGFVTGLAMLLAANGQGQTTFTRVLLTGEPIAGSPFPLVLANQAVVSPSGEQFAVMGQISTGSLSVLAGNARDGFHLVASNNPTISTVPGAPPIATFSSFSECLVDDAGRVLVRADLNGAEGPGLWIDVDQTLSKIVRTGDPVPVAEGLPGVIFATVADLAGGVSFANGRAVFLATLSGPSVTAGSDLSMWVYDAADASLRMVAREGTRWQTFGQPLIDAAGRGAFYGDLLGNSTSTDGVLMSGPFDSLDPMAADGGAAPGTTANYLANNFPLCDVYVQNGLTLNDRGEVAFLATVNSGAGTQQGLWRRAQGLSTTVFKIARQGDAVSGLGLPEPLMGQPELPRLGGGTGVAMGGAIAWRTVLTGAGVTTANDEVLLRWIGAGSPTVVEAVVRERDAASGEAEGVMFNGAPTAFAVNKSGQMLVRGSIIGGPLAGATTSWYASDPNASMGGGGTGLFKIVRVGDQAIVDGVSGLTAAQVLGAGVIQANINGPQSGRPSAISDAGGRSGGGVVVMTMSFLRPEGGTVAGIFTTSLTPDRTGACCRGASCEVTPESQCGPTPAQGRFTGTNIACSAFPNTIAPCCLADFNGSGGAGGGDITVQDLFDYLAAYFAGDPRADINTSGSLSVQDIFDYLAAFFGGCA